MDLAILAFFFFLLLLSSYSIVVSHQLYHLYGNKFYLSFLYYDVLVKTFFFLNFFGRYLVDEVLSGSSSSSHVRIVVNLIFNFVTYPFLAMAIYFFISFVNGISQTRMPARFKWFYMAFQSIMIVTFAVLIKKAIDAKIGQWDAIGREIGIVVINAVLFLSLCFGIVLLFVYAGNPRNAKTKTRLQLLGGYYLTVYSGILFYLWIGQRHFFIGRFTLYSFLVGFNVPVALFLKTHIRKLFMRPSLESVQGVQDYFRHHGISQREAEIVTLICQGKSNQEISDILYLSVQTIKNTIGNIYRKTGVNSRAQLIHSLYKE